MMCFKLFRRYIRHRHTFFELLFLFCVALVPLTWYKTDHVILGHDSGLRLNYPVYFQQLVYNWNPTINFGLDWGLNKAFLLTQVPELLATLLLPYSLGQRVAFVFWQAMLFSSMYLVLRYFYRAPKFWFLRLAGSLFYGLNFFVIQAWFVTERAKFSAMALLPISFLLLYAALKQQISILNASLLFGLGVFFFNAGGSPPLFGSHLLVLLVLVITWFFFTQKLAAWQKLRRAGLVMVSFALSGALMNAYWVLPQVHSIATNYTVRLSEQQGVEGILAWEKMISKFATFDRLFRFQGIPDWYETLEHTYAPNYIFDTELVVLSFIPFLLVIIWLRRYQQPLVRSPYKDIYVTLLVSWLLTLFLMAGTLSPVGLLVQLLFEHIPGFVIFRSLFYKFGIGLWFVGAWLLAVSSSCFLLEIKRRWVRQAAMLAGLYLLLVFHAPYFQGDFFKFSPNFTTQVELPAYITPVAEYLNQFQASSTRVLLLPSLESGGKIESYNWGYFSFDSLLHQTTQVQVLSDSFNSPNVIGDAYPLLLANSQAWPTVVEALGITHVLLRDDAFYQVDSARTDKKIMLESLLSQYGPPAVEAGAWQVFATDQNSQLGQLDTSFITAPRELVYFYPGPVVTSARQPADVVLARPVTFAESDQLESNFVRFFHPDHILYPLSQLKQQLDLVRTWQAEPSQRLEMYLTHAAKNIFDFTHSSNQLTQAKALELFRQNIELAINQAQALSTAEQYATAVMIQSQLTKSVEYVASHQHTSHKKLELSKVIQNLEKVLLTLPSLPFGSGEMQTAQLFFLTVSDDAEYELSGLTELGPLTLLEPTTQFDVWINDQKLSSNPSLLPKGEVEVKIRPRLEDAPDLEYLVIERQHDTDTHPTAEPLLHLAQISPTHFAGRIQNAPADQPYLLKISQTHHQNWNISLDQAEPVEVDGFAQGWILNQAGDFEFEITYAGQRLFPIGLIVSGITTLGAATWLGFNRRKF